MMEIDRRVFVVPNSGLYLTCSLKKKKNTYFDTILYTAARIRRDKFYNIFLKIVTHPIRVNGITL